MKIMVNRDDLGLILNYVDNHTPEHYDKQLNNAIRNLSIAHQQSSSKENKVIIEYDNCRECEHIDHNGRLQINPKLICRKSWDGKSHKFLGSLENSPECIPIPDWCPLIKKEN